MSKKNMKLAVLVPAVLGTLVVISFLVFNAVRHCIIERNEVLVHSVAQNILPALLVNDTQQVQILMKALESYPGVESAELLSAEGASIASYAKAGKALEPMSASFELASAVSDPNQVHVMAPITFDSLIVANLHLSVNLWPIYLRIMTWLGVLLIVPTVIYVLIKQFRLKVRFQKVPTDGADDQGVAPFDMTHAVTVAMFDADISLEYQPIQRLSDGGLFGMEVVVCWHHPSGQTMHVSPADFVMLAEKNGICLPFEDWLLTTACTQAEAWQHQYGPLILTFNITATQFKNPVFAQKIRAVCAQTQYPHQLLELEVNESVLKRHQHKAIANVRAFAEQGLSVTVDRFGLLQTSLDLLAVLPVHKVKLDSKLVKRMCHDAQVDQLVHATITQALAHDVQVMADGLELAQQRSSLQRMGCIFGQGSYFYSPMTASEFENFLVARPFAASAGDAFNMHGNGSKASGFSAA
ncbi:EAL domain-containing protein [Limnohabitans sp. Rim8]|uniref:EAL domain-containing protein n=1 Tax=Limnohabitans sp. Rim8 TaxID=1100718 RepID=UPI000D3AB909|nr:EAL domain-containing protein [Limnohabitans sp. Rim8]